MDPDTLIEALQQTNLELRLLQPSIRLTFTMVVSSSLQLIIVWKDFLEIVLIHYSCGIWSSCHLLYNLFVEICFSCYLPLQVIRWVFPANMSKLQHLPFPPVLSNRSLNYSTTTRWRYQRRR
jgi:hypothetical protein